MTKNKNKKQVINYEILKKNEDADTIIMDQQGCFHDGHYCKHCMACPYITEDVKGFPACYHEDYLECNYG